MEDFDHEASQFTTASTSINSAPERDISEDRGALAGAEQNEKGPKEDDKISLKSQALRPSNASDDLLTREV